MNLIHLQNILHTCKYTCVAYTQEHRYYAKTNGLRPIMRKVRTNALYFQGHIVIDRTIGKAAAMLLVRSKAAYIHGVVMSEDAHAFLSKHQLPHSYDTLVAFIENRERTGICPMEKTVQAMEDVEEAFHALCITIDHLMKNKNT